MTPNLSGNTEPDTFFTVRIARDGLVESRPFYAAQQTAAVLFVTVLTIAAAQVSIPLPFTPVPFTFQPMIVLVCAAALGPRLGMTSQLVYLALGIAGAP